MCKVKVSIIIALTAAFLLSSVSWAAGSSKAALSLKKATETAVENDRTLKLTDEKIKLAQRRYNSAVMYSKDAPDKYWSSDAQHVANKYEELLYPLQRETELNELKWQRQYLEDKLRIDVTKLFLRIQQKQRALENQKSIISRAEEEYQAMKKKVESGFMTDTDLRAYEVTIDEAKTRLDSIQRELDNLAADFNDKLGLPYETEVKLKLTALPEESLEIPSIGEIAVIVAENSQDVKALESDKLIDRTKYDIIRRYSYTLPDEYEVLEDSLLNYDYEIRNKKVSVELKVRSDYNNLLNLEDDIKISELNYNQMVRLAEIEKKRMELDISTQLDYIRAEENRDNAYVALCEAKLNYYIALQDFKFLISPAKSAEEYTEE